MRLFAMRLALAMGRVNVDEMLESISAVQLTEWLAYNRMEPFGEERADLRAGIVAATTANCHRSSRTKAFTPDDFMPKFGPSQPKQSTDELKAAFMTFAGMHNKRLEAK